MENQTNQTENFVVVMIDLGSMRVYSSPYWECPVWKIADTVSEAIAHGYNTIGHGEVEIKILPLAR